MKKGFTLIEALVLVAIIGILGSIIFASLKQQDFNLDNPSSQTTVSGLIEPFYPEPTNYLVDESVILTNEQYNTLITKLADIDTDQQQIAVAIIKTTSPLSIEEYSIKLAEKWKPGKQDDNGALIVVATQDRKVRIEIGYGLEGKINDAAAGRIIDEAMIPSLKNGNWYQAISNAIDAIVAKAK